LSNSSSLSNSAKPFEINLRETPVSLDTFDIPPYPSVFALQRPIAFDLFHSKLVESFHIFLISSSRIEYK